MSVYRRGDKRDEDEERKKKKNEVEQAMHKMGANMEKLGSNLKTFFSGGKEKSAEKKWGKKGAGHTLGESSSSSQAPSSRPHPPPPPPRVQDPAAAQRAAAATAAAAARAAPKRPAARVARPMGSSAGGVGGAGGGAPPSTAPPPVDQSLIALCCEMGFDRLSSQRALERSHGDVSAAIEALTMEGDDRAPAPPTSTPPAPAAISAAVGAAEMAPVCTVTAPVCTVTRADVPSETGARLAACLAAASEMASVHESAVPALQLISKLLSNVASNPAEQKFRKVRLTNAKVSEALARAPAASHRLIQLCGFSLCGDGESVEMGDELAHDAHALSECRAILLQVPDTRKPYPPTPLPPTCLNVLKGFV